MRLKKDRHGSLQLALLVDQHFIINYHQVMHKLSFNPHDHLLELRREFDQHYNLIIIIISHPHVK
jgi:hypothetical protein